MHEVHTPCLSADAKRQPRIDVARRRKTDERHGQRLVERIGCTRRVVEAEKAHVDSALREGRQERQQVAFGTADSSDAVDVQDLHCGLRRRRSAQSIALAARSASRKSVETR